MAEVTINGNKYTLLADSALPSGRRGLSRKMRPAQVTDPGRIRTATWVTSGPIGLSRERGNFLGHDYSNNVETQYDGLITSVAARNTLTLTSQDPTGASGNAKFGGFKFGAAGTKFGGARGGEDGTHIDEDRDHLFFHRGFISTQVDPSDWGVVDSVTHDAPVQGAAVWQGKGYLGLGGQVTIRRRSGVTSSSATYEEALGSTYAKEMTVGNDRLWMVKASADAATDNQAFYSLDALATVSNSFVVGDDKIGATAIGTLGPFTVFGTEVGNFSFTDTGKPVRLSEGLRGHRSINNGINHAAQWGWHYSCTDLGIEAWDGGTVINPAGLESLKGFEGPIDGRPMAVFAWRASLIATYLTTGGDSYILRGEFDDGTWGGNTAATGRPAWFPFRLITSTECKAVYSTSTPTNPTITVSEGTNAAYYTMGRRGRDIADSNYVFSTDGGAWNGSTMTRDNQMLKNVRWGKFITENCDSSNKWQLAVAVDEGSAVNIGSATTTNGTQTVRPVSAGVPLTTVNGYTIKPSLTQVAASSSAPPQIRGTLEIGYDERPEQIEEISAVIHLGQQGQVNETQYDALVALANNDTGSPDTMRINDRDITNSYGFVVGVSERQDLKGDGNMSCTVTLHQWDVD